jgi:hypothetical protein
MPAPARAGELGRRREAGTEDLGQLGGVVIDAQLEETLAERLHVPRLLDVLAPGDQGELDEGQPGRFTSLPTWR